MNSDEKYDVSVLSFTSGSYLTAPPHPYIRHWELLPVEFLPVDSTKIRMFFDILRIARAAAQPLHRVLLQQLASLPRLGLTFCRMSAVVGRM